MKFYQVVQQFGPFGDRRDRHIAFYKYIVAAEERRSREASSQRGGEIVVYACRDGDFAHRVELRRTAATGGPVVDESAGEWRCRCPSDPNFDTSINIACFKACGKCGAERPARAEVSR